MFWKIWFLKILFNHGTEDSREKIMLSKTTKSALCSNKIS